MASGVPCVATDVGDNAWIIGDTGDVVPPRDPDALATALERLIVLGPEGRRRLGAAARARVIENFTLAEVVRQYEALYQRLVTGTYRGQHPTTGACGEVVERLSRDKAVTAWEGEPRTQPPYHRSRPVKRGFANLLIAALACALGLVLIELGLRFAGIGFPNFYTFDARIGGVLRPGAEGWYRKEGEDYIRISSAGLRDREHDRVKPPETLRIAVLGDSYAEAMQLPMSQAFWSVLERELASCRALDGEAVEVINFGVSGYGTAQELLTLRNRVWSYKPDIVVLAFLSGNDVRNNLRALEGDPLRPYFVLKAGELVLDDSFARPRPSDRVSPLGHLYAWLLDHLRIGQLIHDAVQRFRRRQTATSEATAGRRELGVDDEVFKPPTSEDSREAWRVTEALIAEMQQEVQSGGADFLVVTLSNSIQVHPDDNVRRKYMEQIGVPDLGYPDRRIRRAGKRDGYPVLELTTPMSEIAEATGDALHGFGENIGHGHWNAEGHRLAGQLIAARLCVRLTGIGGATPLSIPDRARPARSPRHRGTGRGRHCRPSGS